MSIVRSSKYRHVFGEAPKTDKCYTSVKINKGPWEGNMSSVNSKFLAVSMEGQGGGSFIVICLDKPGRVDLNHPKICGHKGPVLDVQWNPFDDNEIASGSEDCNIKIWTIPDGGISANLEAGDCKAELKGHGKKVNRLAWHPAAANVLASSGFDHVIKVWNTESATELLTLGGFPDKIYSFSWSYNGKYMATSYKEGGAKLRIWNVREQSVMQESVTHPGTKPSHCVFLGTTNQVLTTGYSKSSERQYSLWDAGDLEKGPVASEKIDSSSGVLMPFWDEGTRMFYLIGKGDTNIRYFEVTDQKPYAFFLSQMLGNIPQRGACVMPQHNLDYLRCEVMRFYRLQHTKGVVEPMPMIVPRKSEMLQDDIFKTCYAPKPALSADEWISGVDKDPVLYEYTRDGLVELPPAKCQVSTDIRFKSKEAPKEKAQPEVLKRFGSPEPSSNLVLVTLDDYKRAFKSLQTENEKLKEELATLKAR
ncbi:coronin-1A-like [Halichondria panicea]|uniref:coronin-1A-like n=1 Tax=Halichondria panicea TaxID=6063 RepID=UPI00312BBDA9